MVAYRGDSVAVHDAARGQVSIFDQFGKFGRSVRIDPAIDRAASAFIIGSSLNGDFVLVSRIPAGSSEPTAGVNYITAPLAVMRISAGGELLWKTGALSGFRGEYEVLAYSRSAGRLSMTVGVPQTMPTERSAGVVFSNDLVFRYEESTNELHSYDRQGRLIRRLLLPPMPVPRPLRTTRPTGKQYLSISSDAAGRVWLQIPRSDAGLERHWWVITPAGLIEATAITPAGMTPLWIGTDKIALWAFEADGVEVVRVCGVTKK
jgi:hypothetical protein